MDEKRSWAATAAAILGALGIFDALAGPALIHLGLVSPIFGFQWFFGLGLLEGLLALLIGLLAVFRTRTGSGRSGRPRAYLGLVCGGLLTMVLVVSTAPGRGLPPINDITTDPGSPPTFAGDPSGGDRDMSYPAGFAAQARKAYADLQPIHLSSPPAEALRLAEQTARALGWQAIHLDPARGTLEAQDVTRIFRFVDDIVVRVQPEGAGSRLDVRSKSRDGKGDLGANAARIRTFLAKIPR